MKKSIAMIRPLLIALICGAACFHSVESYGQCDVGIKLISTKKASDNNGGKITIEVNSTGQFECILRIVSGQGIEEVERQNGFGTKQIEFNNLIPGVFYEILTLYHDQQEFFCQKRSLSDIIIEEEKQ